LERVLSRPGSRRRPAQQPREHRRLRDQHDPGHPRARPALTAARPRRRLPNRRGRGRAARRGRYSGSTVLRPRPCLAVLAMLLLCLSPAARAANDPEDIEKELAAKVAKALRKAAEAQKKAAERETKRAKEEREQVAEAEEDAGEKPEKGRPKAAEREQLKRDDPARYEEEVLDDDLEDGVEDYVKKVHRKAAREVPPLPDKATAEQITEHQRALADTIRA